MDIEEKRKIIIGAKKWVENTLPTALSLNNDSYCKILILSTIDCFAQMRRNYPKKGLNDTFCDFVLRFSSQRELLKRVCPVTLHYHYVEKNPLKLCTARVYNWDDPALVVEADRLLSTISDEEKRKTACKEHTYIKLLYELRSKLVHELNNIGTKIELSEDIPSIAYGPALPDGLYWTLNYPRLWLYNLAQETIFGFVDECLKEESLLCFLDTKRMIDLTWH